MFSKTTKKNNKQNELPLPMNPAIKSKNIWAQTFAEIQIVTVVYSDHVQYIGFVYPLGKNRTNSFLFTHKERFDGANTYSIRFTMTNNISIKIVHK